MLINTSKNKILAINKIFLSIKAIIDKEKIDSSILIILIL